MFVTSGSLLHPLYGTNIPCAIRRIHKQTVWYLYAFDIKKNEITWTRRFQRAHQFQNKENAISFIRVHLGKRGEECDTFSEHEAWAV